VTDAAVFCGAGVGLAFATQAPLSTLCGWASVMS